MKKNSIHDSKRRPSCQAGIAGRGSLGAILLVIAAVSTRGQDLERVGSDDPVKVSGSVGARGIAYGSDGIANRRTPFSYTLSGGIDLDVYDLSLPFSFVYSEQERGFSQPFNQFGVSPHYKWLTAHLGFRNITFSPYTLAGHQILGAGIEMNPGKLRLGFMAGRLQRSVEEDTSAAFVLPAYERMALSGKIGYGTEENHIDLIMLKGKDDPASLSRPVIYADVRPAENLVAGASGRFSPVDGLSFTGDFALSDYTRDIRSDELDASGDVGPLGSVIPPRASTQLYMAISAGLAWRIDALDLRASYTRVDPDYQSMGAYYLGNDLESISLAPSLALAGGEIYLNGSFSYQHDNIQMKKRATTARIAPMLNISWTPSSRFGLNVQASDLFTSQRSGNVPLDDTVRMRQSSPSLTVSPRYSIDDSAASHTIAGNIGYQGLIDANRFTSKYTEYTGLNADISYTLVIPASALTLNASINTSRLNTVGGEFGSHGFSLGGDKSFDGDIVKLDGSFGMSFGPSESVINAGAGGRWHPDKHHTAGVNLSLTRSSAADAASRSFTEYTTVASYVYNF